jgi:hypothetical protein
MIARIVPPLTLLISKVQRHDDGNTNGKIGYVNLVQNAPHSTMVPNVLIHTRKRRNGVIRDLVVGSGVANENMEQASSHMSRTGNFPLI